MYVLLITNVSESLSNIGVLLFKIEGFNILLRKHTSCIGISWAKNKSTLGEKNLEPVSSDETSFNKTSYGKKELKKKNQRCSRYYKQF